MKNYRRSLPSLDGLVFFEAAARHNSFTGSASELSVTQAAVSKRIAELEQRLGVKLFHREGRKLSLTGAGLRLQERVATALEFLDDACRSVARQEPISIRIAANSAVSLFWLGPCLRRFGLSPEAVPVTVITTDSLGEQLDAANDLAILHGTGDTPGWAADLLFQDELVPVASPSYMAANGIDTGLEAAGPAGAGKLTLLEYERLAPDWTNWTIWVDRVGPAELRGARMLRFGSYAQSVGAAIDGQGIALGSIDLLGEELRTGRLAVVPGHSYCTGRGYYLAHPRDRILSGAVASLRSCLLDFKRGGKKETATSGP